MVFKGIFILQILTFVAMGIYFMRNGNPNLGVAQLLLALVQGVIYAPGL